MNEWIEKALLLCLHEWVNRRRNVLLHTRFRPPIRYISFTSSNFLPSYWTSSLPVLSKVGEELMSIRRWWKWALIHPPWLKQYPLESCGASLPHSASGFPMKGLIWCDRILIMHWVLRCEMKNKALWVLPVDGWRFQAGEWQKISFGVRRDGVEKKKYGILAVWDAAMCVPQAGQRERELLNYAGIVVCACGKGTEIMKWGETGEGKVIILHVANITLLFYTILPYMNTRIWFITTAYTLPCFPITFPFLTFLIIHWVRELK